MVAQREEYGDSEDGFERRRGGLYRIVEMPFDGLAGSVTLRI